MAGAAMAQAFDQVLATQQRFAVSALQVARSGAADDVRCEHPAPHGQGPAHRHGPRDAYSAFTSSGVTLAYAVYGMAGYSECPSRALPWRTAWSKSS
ncbi:hypothetical protein G6F65_022908 [Rhizopus arrhizus]|nr:hypothetical protein G6F65_022908 [Rhizopus arrhizus]